MTTENNTFKKKLENYWYYYKIHTIIGIFVLLVMIITLTECVNAVKPDLCAACVYTGYTDLSALEQKIADSVGDINGDGKVRVVCDNLYMTGDAGSQQDVAARDKLIVTFVSGEYRLYIMEKEFFETETFAECFEQLDGLLPADSLEGGLYFGDGIIAIPAKNCPYLTDTGIDCEKLYVGILSITDAMKNVKNIDALYDASKSLIKEMVK